MQQPTPRIFAAKDAPFGKLTSVPLPVSYRGNASFARLVRKITFSPDGSKLLLLSAVESVAWIVDVNEAQVAAAREQSSKRSQSAAVIAHVKAVSAGIAWKATPALRRIDLVAVRRGGGEKDRHGDNDDDESNISNNDSPADETVHDCVFSPCSTKLFFTLENSVRSVELLLLLLSSEQHYSNWICRPPGVEQDYYAKSVVCSPEPGWILAYFALRRSRDVSFRHRGTASETCLSLIHIPTGRDYTISLPHSLRSASFSSCGRQLRLVFLTVEEEEEADAILNNPFNDPSDEHDWDAFTAALRVTVLDVSRMKKLLSLSLEEPQQQAQQQQKPQSVQNVVVPPRVPSSIVEGRLRLMSSADQRILPRLSVSRTFASRQQQHHLLIDPTRLSCSTWSGVVVEPSLEIFGLPTSLRSQCGGKNCDEEDDHTLFEVTTNSNNKNNNNSEIPRLSRSAFSALRILPVHDSHRDDGGPFMFVRTFGLLYLHDDNVGGSTDIAILVVERSTKRLVNVFLFNQNAFVNPQFAVHHHHHSSGGLLAVQSEASGGELFLFAFATS